MNFKSKTPKDMIADNGSYFKKNGKTIRKGTMAATLSNADAFESKETTKEEKQEALKGIEALAPTLKAFGLMKHLRWKNPEIQKIFN